MIKFKTIVVILLAVAFIVLGIYGDEPKAMLTKSTNVCLECIGVG